MPSFKYQLFNFKCGFHSTLVPAQWLNFQYCGLILQPATYAFFYIRLILAIITIRFELKFQYSHLLVNTSVTATN